MGFARPLKPGETPIIWPRVSTSKRYLLDSFRQPWLLNHDAGWSASTRLNTAGKQQYFADRASRGFNAVMVQLIERDDVHNSTGANIFGETPFTGTLGGGHDDFTTPREAYWVRNDETIALANAAGLLVMAYPDYLGSVNGQNGHLQAVLANGETRMRQYADFCAERYGDAGIIWMIGGDICPDSNPTPLSNEAVDLQSAFGEQLLTNLPRALTNSHWDNVPSGHLSSDWGSAALRVINAAYGGYTGQSVPDLIARGRAVAGPIPVYHVEGPYAQDGSSDRVIRSQSYHAICGGSCGIAFGHMAIWNFDGPFASNTPWTSYLGGDQVGDHERCFRLFDALEWWRLVPHHSSANVIITAGGGTAGTTSFVSAACTPEGDLLVAYEPHDHTGSFTIDMTKMSGTTRARWWDPRAGTYTTDGASPLANSGTHAFTNPGTNAGGDTDWLLVLDLTP